MQKEQCCEKKCNEKIIKCPDCEEITCDKWLPMVECRGHNFYGSLYRSCTTKLCSECWRENFILVECDICAEIFSACCDLHLDGNIHDLLPKNISLICNNCVFRKNEQQLLLKKYQDRK